ncbi:Uncharacterised protein [Zhongshania aliphaticivorans]|uniref:HXXEE domain-containing protein n=1 Tax=Zhongshania aliphaticivorans TaxID=1470434 RepID=A0A5S9MRU5_9GAMM|nr:HXXEE domain-containing protein [Zhongshania aliphaticivorans]CAA0079479.1 Uncharacterised protein [Zhongshania aliphaticivorans]CAA0086120.1 Uncharacterised protein [Zhongshania aliphaticivorans]
MNVDAIPKFLGRLSYRQAIWLAPLAYLVHILEESQQFAAWASTHFAGGFTTAQFVKNNLIIMGILVGLSVLVTLHPRKWTALLHFYQLCAGMFHMGATAYIGVYSPGLLSAILLYLPVSYYITRLGYREGLLPNVPALVVLVLAGLGHALFVYSQLFTLDLRL